jgi:2-hydroxychromene-2-carboxylate isomerase
MNTTQGPAPIEFWFDFASGYAYFAALEIEALAERHGRNVLWRPFTLGAAFKVTGAQGLSRTPLKGDYARRDWQRLARLKGVVFKLPERHPKAGLAAIRTFYHIDRLDSPAAGRFAKRAIIGYFRDGLDTDDSNAIAQMASALLGVDRDSVLAGISDSEVKAIARQHGEAAVRRGVFGSPWIFVDGVLGQRSSRHGGAMAWWRPVVSSRSWGLSRMPLPTSACEGWR